jgi:Flp pilus assembly protein TadD
MSLLMKALKHAERPPQSSAAGGGADWSLEPMASNAASGGAAPRTAQVAADLIRAREASREGTRLAILLGVLVLVVVGMGGYFYIAVYMPWLLLPKPAASPVVAAAPAAPAPITQPITTPVGANHPQPAAPAMAQPKWEPAPAATRPSPQEPQPLAPAPTKPKAAPREEVRVAPTERAARVVVPAVAPTTSDGLMAAYDLLQSGQYEQARQAYEKLRIEQPANADVVLGLAVIAQRQNRAADAAQLYLRAVELDPRNSFAQAALVGLIGKADPAAAETRLKQFIAQQPAAYLHFALGNVYAAQGRWHDAQASYFEAQRLEPESADYAFNLAVSLERIGQTGVAADYYQRALRLAQSRGAASFDPAQARSRLQQLSRQ